MKRTHKQIYEEMLKSFKLSQQKFEEVQALISTVNKRNQGLKARGTALSTPRYTHNTTWITDKKAFNKFERLLKSRANPANQGKFDSVIRNNFKNNLNSLDPSISDKRKILKAVNAMSNKQYNDFFNGRGVAFLKLIGYGSEESAVDAMGYGISELLAQLESAGYLNANGQGETKKNLIKKARRR